MPGADVVLSHHPDLADAARTLRTALEAQGLTVWSSSDIPLGVSFRDAIETAVTRASALVVLYNTSQLGEWQRVELAAALPRTLVVPCATTKRPGVPPELASYRSLRLDTPQAVETIARQIAEAVASAPVTDPGEPPSGLVDAVRLGSCVLAVGNAPLGPQQTSQADFAGRLLEWASRHRHVDSRRAASLELGLRLGEVDLVLDTISAAAAPDELEQVVSDLIPAQAAPAPAYAVLGQLPFTSVVTLRHDDVAEQLFTTRLHVHPAEALEISVLTVDQHAAATALALGQVDGRRLLGCGTSDGRLLTVDLEDGVVRFSNSLVPRATRLAFGQLGDRPVLASGHEDGAVGRWDPRTLEPLGGPPLGHSTAVSALAFGSLGGESVLASGATDGSVNVWRPGRTQPSLIAAVDERVTALGFRPGGRQDGAFPARLDAVVAFGGTHRTLAVPGATRDSIPRQYSRE